MKYGSGEFEGWKFPKTRTFFVFNRRLGRDSTVKKTHYSGREKKRADPICAFLTPDKHVDTSELGVILINAGIQMVCGSMEGVAVTSEEVQYYNTVFGINVHSNNKDKDVNTGTKKGGSTKDM